VKPTVVSKVAPVKFRRNLSAGSRGDDVLYLQRRLTELGYLPGAVKGKFTTHTRHAVIAFQKVNGLKRDGVVRKATYALLSNPKVAPVRYPKGDHVEINKSLQVLIVVRNGMPKYIVSTSTGGKKHTTPSVSSAVDWKAGAKYVSKKYNGIMNWPSFFYGGVAVHGYASVPPYPASHGCARIPVDDAKFIYNNMPKGSMVYVY
jgi:peptidoglycan hydrolase-like protein with peptidoglycan-binding domain